ncbi:hypothetical protein [Massilia soli]|uniref:Uncharacterized protein n=1 Tax=Massilia soli TaxID=2792854 RepID=A0ABS7SM22_9BURK|nr:hypothetical protein [Massilia soli]MBZ2206870.1 hypothetical protein [Massilia soli]
MEAAVDYEQVGRFIYGFIRVRGSFDAFCRALEQGAHPLTPETPLSQYADQTQVVLSQRYGAGSVIAREFSEVAAVMLAGDGRMSQIKSGFDAVNVPGDAETDGLLSVQARLDHIRQLMSAAR